MTEAEMRQAESEYVTIDPDARTTLTSLAGQSDADVLEEEKKEVERSIYKSESSSLMMEDQPTLLARKLFKQSSCYVSEPARMVSQRDSFSVLSETLQNPMAFKVCRGLDEMPVVSAVA